MGTQLLRDVAYHLTRDINPNNDPRVGSARDNSTSTSVSKVTTGTNSSSVTTLFVTFVPVAVYAAVCVIIFLILRRRYPRVYAPRTFLSSLDPHERTPKLPSGYFNWIISFYRISDTYVLNHSSLDGFLFLRFLKILIVICLVGCILTWPVLLPLHVHGGGGDLQLDLLTFGNIAHPSWYFVHAFLAWIYFGFILYMVSRECVYFINLRQAYLLSPYYADRLSSRTVLFTCVPQQILDERKLRRVFGDTVKNVWIPRETEDLVDLVNERDQTAVRLEKAEIVLIKKANEAYRKAVKNGHPDIEATRESFSTTKSKEADGVVTSVSSDSPQSPASPEEYPRADGTPIMKTNYGPNGPPPDINGSVAAQWIPHNARPVHRPIANYGRRVDTIKWTRNRLKVLAPQISKLRRQHKKGNGAPIPAAFIEFHTQVDAQSAYQTLAHHRANHMRSEIIGMRPQEIVWPSLYMSWWQRIIRKFLIQGFVAVMVVFWSIPAALIGIVSNVSFLTTKVPFLHWINLLPKTILSLIEGLLPAVALSLLMATVPFVMRACARQAGVPTASKIELFTQNCYFVFQIVQVFLITTLTSAASSAITQIISDPLSARSLLSQNLPKASNFYISYFILQGLALSATRIVHAASLVRHQLMANSPANPRLLSAKYHRLRRIHWGSVYPVFTNMGVIAISYSLIAPILLFPAVIGFSIIYVSYRYNLLYVYGSPNHAPSLVTPDTRGLLYPRALKHTLTGVYLAEICLLGLFGLRSAFGPVVMMFGLIIFTALIHVSLSDALSPLLYNLPRTLAAEEELRKAGNRADNAENLEDKNDGPDIEDAETAAAGDGYDSDFDPGDPANEVSHGEQQSRNGIPVEGADRALNLTSTTLKTKMRTKYYSSPLPKIIAAVDFWTYWFTPDPNIKPNFLLKFLHPEIFADYHILRDQMILDTKNFPEIVYPDGAVKDAFYPDAVRRKAPRLWIPRDTAGVSTQEVAHSGKVVEITDEGAWIDEKNCLISDEHTPEVGAWVLREKERVIY